MMLRRRTDGTRRGDMGFTLIELLITSVILPIVLSAAYLVFITLSGDYSIISAQSEATSEAQRAMDTLVRELRQAQQIEDGSGAFAVTQPDRCSFYCDIDRDNVPERITYYTDGTDLFRVVAESTTHVFPYNFVDAAAVRVVNLTTSSQVVFTYYDAADPLTVDTTPNPASVCAVGIHLSASRPSQNGQVNVDFSTRVKIRALFNSLS